jgi:hypothetical protein
MVTVLSLTGAACGGNDDELAEARVEIQRLEAVVAQREERIGELQDEVQALREGGGTQTETERTTQPEAPEAEAPAPQAPSAGDDPTVTRIRQFLREEYGGEGAGAKTSWYDDIKSISPPSGFDGVVEVETDLFPDADAAEPAEAICGAVFSAGLFLEIEEVAGARVLDSQGGTLHECP